MSPILGIGEGLETRAISRKCLSWIWEKFLRQMQCLGCRVGLLDMRRSQSRRKDESRR